MTRGSYIEVFSLGKYVYHFGMAAIVRLSLFYWIRMKGFLRLYITEMGLYKMDEILKEVSKQ